MVDRIASFSQTSRLVSHNLRLEAEYAQGQTQLASGLKSSSLEGIASDTRQIMSLESEYQRISIHSENAQMALNRSEAMYDAMSSMLSEAQNFVSDLNAALSGSVSDTEIAQQAQTSRDSIVSSLNREFQGRYLFSGSATNVAPVDINAVGYGGAVTPSVADVTYYQGNDFIHSVEASEGFTVDYGVTADNAVFEELLRVFDLVMTTPGDQATQEEAHALLLSAIDDLAVLQAQTSQDSSAMNRVIDEHVEQLNLIDNLITDLTAVDLAAVTVKIAELDAQLQASYSVTSDLLRLNLTDFLR
ncbi:MAG: hypothetical protein ACRBCT_00285 [Alphaproteobacteria bacterium]